MTAKQINSEIEYRLAKWVAFHLLQQGIISIEEYEKACADFPQENTIRYPGSCPVLEIKNAQLLPTNKETQNESE